ncbi:PREDICTED: L-serine dehydratase/L-threonine deaminase-like [Acropora digitifera]|uniref:L-serine dehydratase/L-threonine deaminase-like n=1 Tax=Acropora digitifera TaxID=70779 RepID=UPI00077A93B5|nr:PREDICTED: L-serine dehydratase/L-threonine deaminase-like [Acropora digitifera]
MLRSRQSCHASSWRTVTKMETEALHIKTPVLESHPLTTLSGFRVFLKLENVQPVSSFKIRGVGNLCQKAMRKGCNHMVCSSGGNAGLAAAYSARKLGVSCTVVVPGTTPAFMVERLREEKAVVEICGDSWDDADALALKLAKQPGYAYIPPFNHPDIWEGVATVIQESAAQLPEKPSAVVVSVGGGGLMAGVLQGMQDVGWDEVPLIAMETKGANCFDAAVQAGKLVTLDEITSSTDYGHEEVRSVTYFVSNVNQYIRRNPIIGVEEREEPGNDVAFFVLHFSGQDALAFHNVLLFLVLNVARFLSDDHRMLVEPACGASLACVYERLFEGWKEQGKLAELKSVLVIVCGGNIVSLKALKEWKEKLGLS